MIHRMDLPIAIRTKLKEEALMKMRNERKTEELPVGQAEKEKNVLDYGTIPHTSEEMDVPKEVVRRNTKTKVPRKKWPKPDGSVFTYRKIIFTSNGAVEPVESDAASPDSAAVAGGYDDPGDGLANVEASQELSHPKVPQDVGRNKKSQGFVIVLVKTT